MWSKKELDTEMTWEEFQAKMLDGGLKPWISRKPRKLSSWLFSVELWARGDH